MQAQLTREVVKLQDGKELVVIFSLPRKMVPEGIQVIPASGGIGAGNAPQEDFVDVFNKVHLDLQGLMSRCSVDSINVRENSAGYCRVYVNCTVGTKGEVGFNHWAGPYEKFVRRAFSNVWGKAIMKNADDRMSLEVRNPFNNEVCTKLLFAIEK